ncbi:MAG: ribose 5-phosphate isomerase B [Thermotogaceae bacterium]|nr:ribose 5-phosphate isomerase B [Thermotogaceae bacterium]
MRISIGTDHAGFRVKEAIKSFLMQKGYKVIDNGTYSEDSVDYPDFAKKVAQDILNNEADYGILLCGTGIGMSIAANKFKGIKAALCLLPKMASLSKMHNDANVLVLPGRLIGIDLALWIVEAFLESEFEGGRHEERVKKIEEFENHENCL